MSTHPYLRAYMAGITLPTLFLLVIMTCFFVVRHIYAVSIPFERMIVFPMAIIPNLFGVWNMLYLRLNQHRYVSIGIHGAFLPFVLLPVALTIASSLGFLTFKAEGAVYFEVLRIPYKVLATLFPMVLVVYYLIWKYLVKFFNELLGIA